MLCNKNEIHLQNIYKNSTSYNIIIFIMYMPPLNWTKKKNITKKTSCDQTKLLFHFELQLTSIFASHSILHLHVYSMIM